MHAGLGRLGWRAPHRRALEALGDPALRPARVLARDRGRVLVHDGERETHAPIAGRVLHTAERGDGVVPATGDWVVLDGAAAVAGVLPRRGVIARGSDDGPDVLAAHVDLLLVAHAPAQDEALARVPRFLAIAADGDVPAVVLVTKADLLEDPAATVAEVTAATGGAARALAISSVTGDGLDALRDMTGPSVTVAVVGASGAGKSTLINALLGTERQQTGEVRAHDGRGRHVTVRRELIPLPGGGLLVDTPGLRVVGVRGGVEEAFSDVAALAAACRFPDCSHTAEPGCAVLAAIERGELDPARLDAARHLEREADHALAQEDAALRRASERRQRSTDTAYRREQRRNRRG